MSTVVTLSACLSCPAGPCDFQSRQSRQWTIWQSAACSRPLSCPSLCSTGGTTCRHCCCPARDSWRRRTNCECAVHPCDGVNLAKTRLISRGELTYRPTKISSNCAAEAYKNALCVIVAIILAKYVLPVPGGPCNKILREFITLALVLRCVRSDRDGCKELPARHGRTKLSVDFRVLEHIDNLFSVLWYFYWYRTSQFYFIEM